MPKRDVRIALLDMRDHAREAIGFSSGRRRSDLDTDRMLQLSLMQLVQIIGEAANSIPLAEHTKHPQIPWKQIIGVRNRLVHAYDRVDPDILWEIVTRDLPLLLANLEDVLATMNSGV